MLAKAAEVPADELVVDLEDAVAAPEKDVARTPGHAGAERCVARALRRRPRQRNRHVVVSPRRDRADQRTQSPRAIVVPKVESAGDIAFVDRLMSGAERGVGIERPIRVQALIESAAGLLRIGEIAEASDRLEALILDYADLTASLGRSAAGAGDLDGWRFAQESVLTAARTHGLAAVDGPYLGVDVDPPFVAAVQRARDAGFDSKWAIHPRQLQTLNERFLPTASELERAQAILDALEAAEREQYRGAVAHQSTMLDEATRTWAAQILARRGERR